MSPPTSVLMLTNAVAPDKLGGLERYVRELSAALVSLGLPVTVLTKRISDDDPQEETGSDGFGSSATASRTRVDLRSPCSTPFTYRRESSASSCRGCRGLWCTATTPSRRCP